MTDEPKTCTEARYSRVCGGDLHEREDKKGSWCEECGSLFINSDTVFGIDRAVIMMDVFRARTDYNGEADYDDYSAILEYVYGILQEHLKDEIQRESTARSNPLPEETADADGVD